MNHISKVNVSDHKIITAFTPSKLPSTKVFKFNCIERSDLPTTKLSCSITKADKVMITGYDKTQDPFRNPSPERRFKRPYSSDVRVHQLFSNKNKIALKKPGLCDGMQAPIRIKRK